MTNLNGSAQTIADALGLVSDAFKAKGYERATVETSITSSGPRWVLVRMNGDPAGNYEFFHGSLDEAVEKALVHAAALKRPDEELAPWFDPAHPMNQHAQAAE